MTEPKYYTKQQASDFLTRVLGLPVATKTLSKFISTGGGPLYRKFGNRVVYTETDLISWAKARLSDPKTNSSAYDAQ